jgi:rubrerythrin
MEGKDLEIIKGAILLERKGRALYSTTAAGASSPALRQLFETLAEEEEKHQAWLERSYVELATEGRASGLGPAGEVPGTVIPSLIEAVKAQIGAASNEAAAISAAMALEQGAVAFYSAGARDASDPESRKLFALLSGWEGTHLEMLAALDEELRKSIWFDNSFWPSI